MLLSEDIWTLIFQILPLADLTNLICTNHAMYDLFFSHYCSSEDQIKIQMLNWQENPVPVLPNSNRYSSRRELTSSTTVSYFPIEHSFSSAENISKISSQYVTSIQEFEANLSKFLESSFVAQLFVCSLLDLGFVIAGSIVQGSLRKQVNLEAYKTSDVDFYFIQELYEQKFISTIQDEKEKNFLRTHPDVAIRNIFQERIIPQLESIQIIDKQFNNTPAQQALRHHGFECLDNSTTNIVPSILLHKSDQFSYFVFKKEGIMNIISQCGRPVQLVTKYCDSVADVLLFADLDCTRFVYDGQTIFSTKSGLASLLTKVNPIPAIFQTSTPMIKRVVKYNSRDVSSMWCNIHPLTHYWSIEQTAKYIVNQVNYSNLIDRTNLTAQERRMYDRDSPSDSSRLIDTPFLTLCSTINRSQFSEFRCYSSFAQVFAKDLSPVVKKITSDSFWRKWHLIGKCYECGKYFPVNKTVTQTVYQPRTIYEKITNMGQFCFDCGKLNLMLRNQTKDLTGKVAIVLGCSSLEGKQIVLQLLKSGATVVGITRFVCSTLVDYAMEAEYDLWKNRLDLYPLDLSSSKLFQNLFTYVQKKYKEIHFIVHNVHVCSQRGIVGLLETEENHGNYLKGSKNMEEVEKGNLILESIKETRSLNTCRLPSKFETALESVNLQILNTLHPTLLISLLKPLLSIKSKVLIVIDKKVVDATNSVYYNASQEALREISREFAIDYATQGIIVQSVQMSSDSICKLLPIDYASRVLKSIFESTE